MKNRILALFVIFLVCGSSLAVFEFQTAEAAKDVDRPMSLVSPGSSFDWPSFWTRFRTHAAWRLEWFNGSSWIQVSEALQVLRDYPQPNHCKITLIFDAPEAGNYQLTFGVDELAKQYFQLEDKFQWIIEYQGYWLTFDWSDLAEISGLQLTKGMDNGYFWFRIRRDNVPKGYHLELDPCLVADAERWCSQNWRINDNTFFVMIEMNQPVVGQHDLFRSTDGAKTWIDLGCITETYGSNQSVSAAGFAIDVNDNNIIHITWQDYSGTYQIRHTIWNNTAGAFQQNTQVINKRGYNHWMEADSNNVLHLVMDDLVTSSGSATYLRYVNSTDGGQTWSTPYLLDTNGWNDWQVNFQILVTRNNVLNVKWRENDPGSKNHRYMYMRRFTNGTWSSAVDVAGSFDSTSPGGGSDWSSDPQDRLIYTLHNGSSGFSPMKGADIYVTYTTQPTNYSGSLGWIEPIKASDGWNFIQDPSVQIDDSGAAHIICQELPLGWYVEGFPNIENASLHYIKEASYPWNNWTEPARLNYWHSQCGFGFTRGTQWPTVDRVNSSLTFDFMFMVWRGETEEYDIYHQRFSLIFGAEAGILNMEGCGNWVFADERTGYQFRANITAISVSLDTIAMRFYEGTGHEISFYYDNVTGTAGIWNGSDYIDIRIQDTALINISETQYYVIWEVYFRNTIIDTLEVDLWLFANATTGEEVPWQIVEMDYFNIYNLGGQASLSTGWSSVAGPVEAGRLQGGDAFEVYCMNNSWALATVAFTKVRHVKLLVGLYYHESGAIAPANYWFGANFCAVDTWHTVYIEMAEEDFYHGGTNEYVSFNATLYYEGAKVTSQLVYGYWEPERRQYRLWVDLWFHVTNASSVFGTRIGSYFYGMHDSAHPWLQWLTGSYWGPIHDNASRFLAYTNLLDSGGAQIHATEITMVKYWVKVLQPTSAANTTIAIRDVDVFDQVATPDGSGVTTPVYDPPQQPAMKQGGFLGAIKAALGDVAKRIGDALGPAVLGFWNMLVGFLDSIAAWAGYPHLFTNLFTWMGSFWTWTSSSVGYVITMLTSVFSFWTAALGGFLAAMTTVLQYWVQMAQQFISFLDDGLSTGYHIWTDFGLSNWLILAAILYPIWLLALWEEKGIMAAVDNVRFLLESFLWLFNILLSIVQFFIALIGRIIESIPILE